MDDVVWREVSLQMMKAGVVGLVRVSTWTVLESVGDDCFQLFFAQQGGICPVVDILSSPIPIRNQVWSNTVIPKAASAESSAMVR